MKKISSLLIIMITLLICINVKAKETNEEEFKSYNIKRSYVICNYVFDISSHNPTLKDFLIASQTCPKEEVTIYEIKYYTDIDGNARTSYTELLDNKKLDNYPKLDISYIYRSEILPNNRDQENKIVIGEETNYNNNIYTVTFDLDGGSHFKVWNCNTRGCQYSFQTSYYLIVKNGETYGDAATIKNYLAYGVRSDYIFDGWYTEKNGKGDRITPESAVNLSHNITLYANWLEKVNVSYKIIHENSNDESLENTLEFAKDSTILQLKEYFMESNGLYKYDGIYKDINLSEKCDDNYILKENELYYVYYKALSVNIYSRVVGEGEVTLSKNILSGNDTSFTAYFSPANGFTISSLAYCRNSFDSGECITRYYYDNENQTDIIDNDITYDIYVTVTYKELDDNIKTYLNGKEINIICDELTNAKYFSENLMYTKDNRLFAINMDSLYSNNQNCIYIGTAIYGNENNNIGEVKGIIGNTFVDNNKKRYMVNSLEIQTSGELGYNYNTWYYGYKNSDWTEHGISYDGNNYYLTRYNEAGTIINDTFDENEEILSINNGIVKTNKKYYSLYSQITNQEQCNKYADVSCIYEYSFKEMHDLSYYYDEIVTVSRKAGRYIDVIDNEGNLYSYYDSQLS